MAEHRGVAALAELADAGAGGSTSGRSSRARRRRSVVFAAVVAALAVAGGAVAFAGRDDGASSHAVSARPAATTSTSTSSTSTSTTAPIASPGSSGLPLASELQGRRLASDAAATLEQSVLALWRRPVGSSYVWEPVCGASKANAGGRTVIVTAAHCLRDPAFEYAVSVGYDNQVSPDAIVDRWAGNDNDIAVAAIRRGTATGDFDAQRTVAYPTTKPVHGDEVAMFGGSQWSGYVARSARGVYLGESTFTNDSGVTFTVSVVAQLGRYEGVIGLGASGSPALTPSGFLGPVIFEVGHESRPGVDDWYRDRFGSEFGVDLRGVESIGEYAVITQATITRLAATLPRP